MKRFFPILALTGGLLLAFSSVLRPVRSGTEFASLPVLADGRVKPMDTLARNALLSISGKRIVRSEGRKMPAQEWLLETMMRPDRADLLPIFPITNPDLRNLFGWREDAPKMFSFQALVRELPRIDEQAAQAGSTPKENRSAFQREVLKLRSKLQLYVRLKNTLVSESAPDFAGELATLPSQLATGLEAIEAERAGKSLDAAQLAAKAKIVELARVIERLAQTTNVAVIPREPSDASAQRWETTGASLSRLLAGGDLDPALTHYFAMVAAYRAADVAGFQRAAAAQSEAAFSSYPAATKRIGLELLFNRFQPFYGAMTLYVLAFLLAWVSWLVWPIEAGRAAFWLLVLAFVLHTGGLVVRMLLQGRPPVTNLYSSAVFVGWGCVLLCLVLERSARNGLAIIVGAALAFVTLLIAHHLSIDGDTLEMMRAVLDTNIWLATHVVVVTMGYSATLLAGALSMVVLLRGVFTRSLTPAMLKKTGLMVYGVVCFAMLFSFVGTILGGIWADQSWGRFWGWDPKENGALLIVIWNALILHAKLGGMIRERGLLILAVAGTIVTSFSWFGVNMLGVGLHSYGFMDEAFAWLAAFATLQLAIIGLGLSPRFHPSSLSYRVPN